MAAAAVPLLRPEVAPRGHGDGIYCGQQTPVRSSWPGASGVVESVDAARIVLKSDASEKEGLDTGVDIYNLVKYQRSNQDTCFNQKPICCQGAEGQKGGDHRRTSCDGQRGTRLGKET